MIEQYTQLVTDLYKITSEYSKNVTKHTDGSRIFKFIEKYGLDDVISKTYKSSFKDALKSIKNVLNDKSFYFLSKNDGIHLYANMLGLELDCFRIVFSDKKPRCNYRNIYFCMSELYNDCIMSSTTKSIVDSLERKDLGIKAIARYSFKYEENNLLDIKVFFDAVTNDQNILNGVLDTEKFPDIYKRYSKGKNYTKLPALERLYIKKNIEFIESVSDNEDLSFEQKLKALNYIK